MTSWTAWADSQPELPPAARGVLERELGPLTPSTAVAVTDADLPDSQLTRHVVERFKQVVDRDALQVDDETRARHAGGQAYVDIARRRRGDGGAAPDAVGTPTNADVVARVLQVCADENIAVVPWGGGTSVVGGLDAERGESVAVVALDLSRLDAALKVDAVSGLAGVD